jgi:hypothetical protein
MRPFGIEIGEGGAAGKSPNARNGFRTAVKRSELSVRGALPNPWLTLPIKDSFLFQRLRTDSTGLG